MNDSRYRLILYAIVLVILGTIGIQAYWNYKNYLTNKQQLINDVQISLDNAVDAYYTKLAERTTMGFAVEERSQKAFFKKNGTFEFFMNGIDSSRHEFKTIDSLDMKQIDGISIYRGANVDSILNDFHVKFRDTLRTRKPLSKWSMRSESDSLIQGEFELLTSKIVISITTDSLNLKTIDTLLQKELARKSIDVAYGLSFKNHLDSIQNLNIISTKPNTLSTESKSTFLPKNSSLKIHFTNETKLILKRIFSGILISTLLVLAVIACLFYLLKIIKHQKQLAEVKNDLISNITHEFKTPIATIGVALESIKNFNVIDDKEKTKSYLEMSSNQLSKLNMMVEKLLETASLDSGNLNLNKEEINIIDVLFNSVKKHQMQTENKTIHFSPNTEGILAKVDVFHFDNAINNMIDNAIKYGGNDIYIEIEQNSFAFTVSISDTGNSLTKVNKEKIFEKFYRVSRGNTHDVKGFGIGLYYTKKIVEKHGGTIHLDLNNNCTTFKLSLPNA